MPVKIRLQRHGRTKRPFYHIVIADSRSKRDGRFIERIGDYNPLTIPASINVDVEKAVEWMEKGAQPTNTVRSILSYKGAMYLKHLKRGVSKGAFSEEDAMNKFAIWQDEHKSAVLGKISDISKAKDKLRKDKEAAEAEKRAAQDAEKKEALQKAEAKAEAEKAEAEAAEKAAAEEANTEANTEATAEAPAEGGEPIAEAAEAPAEEAKVETPEVKEEAPAEEAKAETPEVKEEAPADEAKAETPEVKEEAPAEEAKEDTASEGEATEDKA